MNGHLLYIIETTVITLTGIKVFLISRSLHVGYQMAREWHEDGASLDVLSEVPEPWGTRQDTRYTLKWAIKIGWRVYIRLARLRVK